METTCELFFEELEAQEELTEWWQYALAGAAGIGLGIIAYVAIGAAT